MNIEQIESELEKIINEYKNTLFPKRYISDARYIQLTKDLEYLNAIKEKKAQEEQQREKFSFNMNQQRFDELPKEIQDILVQANYNYLLDPDNILNWYPSAKTEIADKVMLERINVVKKYIEQQKNN